jgi:hypothetical protein
MNRAGASAESRITIERWLNSWVVDAGTFGRPEVGDVMHRIDRSVAEDLPDCFARSMPARCGATEAVWRIREIDLGFTVDLGSPESWSIAKSWSERVAARVMEIVERGAESDGVLCFQDRSAYLAQFVLDLAAGRAWGKWYYEEFRSLDQLTAGRAIVEALTQKPEDGVSTLLHLTRCGTLERILCVLTGSDARTLFECCFGGLGDIDEPGAEGRHRLATLSQWSGRLLDVWSDEPIRASHMPQPDPHDAVCWMTKVSVRFPGAEREPAALAALSGLLALRRVLAAIRSPIDADRLVRMLTRGDLTLDEAIGVARKEGADSAERGLEFLNRVAHGDPDWAAQAAAQLLRDKMQSAGGAWFDGESMITPFGGAFMIAPSLIELGLKEIAESAAGDGEQGQDAAAFLRHLVLSGCLRGDRRMEASSDQALRLLSGYHCSGDWEEHSFAADCIARAQSLFAGKLAALAECDDRLMLAELVRPPEQERKVLLLRDVARNAWLFAAAWPGETAEQERTLVSALECVREATGNLPYLVLRGLASGLEQADALRGRTVGVVSLLDAESGAAAAAMVSRIVCLGDSTCGEQVARMLASSDAEFQYFSNVDSGPNFDPALDALTTLLRRAGHKGFARRLMGFQSASPEHLYRNFLAGVSTVRILPQRIEVELPHSPLSLVLHLSGIDRQAFTVPWLEGREVCLLPSRE